MQFVDKLKRIFCRHNYQLFANIYGDLVHDFDARTVYICKKCGKRKYVKDYIEAPLNYNNFLQDCANYRQTGILQVSANTFKNIEQYEKLFDPQERITVLEYDSGGHQ